MHGTAVATELLLFHALVHNLLMYCLTLIHCIMLYLTRGIRGITQSMATRYWAMSSYWGCDVLGVRVLGVDLRSCIWITSINC